MVDLGWGLKIEGEGGSLYRYFMEWDSVNSEAVDIFGARLELGSRCTVH